MTKEQEKATISALLEEKRGYELRLVGAEEDEDEDAAKAAKERIKEVDKELRRLGAKAKKPSARASKRKK